jgi:hypothetical protein
VRHDLFDVAFGWIAVKSSPSFLKSAKCFPDVIVSRIRCLVDLVSSFSFEQLWTEMISLREPNVP